MKVLLCFLIAFHASLQACLDQQATTVSIQNYDGPIYLHPPSCDRNQETYECTCVKQPIYNTGSVQPSYPGTQPNCATNTYNTGTYLGSYYPQTVDQKFCPIDIKKSCPKTVDLDTNLMYGLPQNYQNRQCEFKFASYY